MMGAQMEKSSKKGSKRDSAKDSEAREVKKSKAKNPNALQNVALIQGNWSFCEDVFLPIINQTLRKKISVCNLYKFESIFTIF